MIFTVEPGIYDSQRGGIRLEDDVLVGADGPVMLSTHPLQLRILGWSSSARTSGASCRGCRRSPSSTAAPPAGVEEDPAAVAARGSGAGGDTVGVGEQLDRVGCHGEAHAPRLVVSPVQPIAAM